MLKAGRSDQALLWLPVGRCRPPQCGSTPSGSALVGRALVGVAAVAVGVVAAVVAKGVDLVDQQQPHSVGALTVGKGIRSSTRHCY